MSFKDLTDDQRKAMREKSAATRRANAAKRHAETPPPALATDVPSLADLGFAAELEEDFVPDGFLTAEEILAAEEEGRRRYRDEQRKKARKSIADAAFLAAQQADGTEPPDAAELRYQTELVQVRVEMPRLRKPTGGEQPPEPIILDQRVFVSGRTYTVERRLAVYLADLMDKARRHVNQVDGRGRVYYSQEAGAVIYQGGLAQGGVVSPSFDAIHRRPAA